MQTLSNSLSGLPRALRARVKLFQKRALARGSEIGLIIGPLFVAAELVFLLGLRRDLQHAIEERAGPTRTGRATAAT